MVVEVPRRKLIEFIVHFEDLLGRAYGFVGLHPHDFPRDEGKNLDSLRGLVVQMKSVAGGVSAVVIKDDEEAKVDGLELVMVHVDGIPFKIKESDLEEEDEGEEEIGHEPVIKGDSEHSESIESEESDSKVDEESIEEPIIEVEEEKLDEEVEAEIEKDEVQAEEGKESREKIEALEAQLAALKKELGD